MKLDDEMYIMWLSRIKGINSSKLDSLMEYFGSAEAVYRASGRELQDVVSERSAAEIVRASSDGSLEKYVWELERADAAFISKYNENFPEGLKNIDDIPKGIYYRGRLPQRESRLVSMVGSRRCTSYGKQAALYLAGELAENGVEIVSGMAAGIDSHSHEGALKHNGITHAVFGTAIDRCYPADNRELMESILERGGCVISEYGPSETTYSSDFVRRNRIIAGLSEALVVVEAERKSGTFSTLEAALKYGRSVFAVPGSILSKYSEGTNLLIKEGCPPVTEADDILNELGINNKKTVKSKRADMPERLEGVSENGRSIIKCLEREPMDFESLAAATGIQESRLRAELTLLEIRKLVEKLPGQRYILVL